MKSKFLFLLLLFCSGGALAQTINAPQTINVQAVLVDDGGNVVDKQEGDMTFSIIDGAGAVLYTEAQHVILVHGAISILVGQGNDPVTGQPTGGIPYDVFSPDGDRLLRMKLDDQSVPQEDLQIVSVPYAMYAQYALGLANPLDSSGILDGAIKQEDLSPELIAFIESMSVASSDVPLTASAISVENNFVNAAGRNIQSVLQGFDLTIGILKNQDDLLQTDIDSRVLRAGDTMTGNLSFDNSKCPGNVCLVDGVDVSDVSSRIPDVPNDANGDGKKNLDDLYVNVDGDTMTGPLTATAFSGGGSGLTGLNGTNITSGTVADARIASTIARVSQIPTLPDFTNWDQDKSDDLMTTTVFGGDVTGTYDNIQVATGTIKPPDLNLPDFSEWDQVKSDDLTKATQFAGDVFGQYDATQGKVMLNFTTPQQPTPAEKTAFAYGHCEPGVRSGVSVGILTGYNVDTTINIATDHRCDQAIYFETSPASANYSVVVTPITNARSGSGTAVEACGTYDKSTAKFHVFCNAGSGVSGSGQFDFIVFYNP